MSKRFLATVALYLCAVVLLLTPILHPRTLYLKNEEGKFKGSSQLAVNPDHCMASHRIGNMTLAISNNGTFGIPYSNAFSSDCFTGRGIGFGCEVPKNGGVEYLFGGAFWIGAIVGRDTLVTVGHDGWQSNQEFSPDEAFDGNPKAMKKRSIIDPNIDSLFRDAISEEDFIACYTDTADGIGTYDGLDPFGHRPIGIEVTQKSFAWSYEYAENFILFDYRITNIGDRPIRDVFMGVYVDADVGANPQEPHTDDLCGYTHTFLDTFLTCEYVVDANIAWITDNNGDLGEGYPAAPGVTGTRIVRTPADSLEISFNWWIGNGDASRDFGPRKRPTADKPFRDYGTGGLGTPEGDRNKYYALSNGEFDYDQAYTASISASDSIWLQPNQGFAGDFADGFDTRYLLSFGPFDIDPGEELPISFAYVSSENFHVDEDNIKNLPNNPNAYYKGLNFKNFLVNARWAGWIYDNPGVDTDSNGYAGEMRFCVIDSAISEIDSSVTPYDTFYARVDTIFATGDGVPDFKGASPPPAPALFIEPSVGLIKVRFNGYRTETTKDPFSRIIDFEGYRIYIARDDRATSYSRLVSYDRENFNKWVFNKKAVPQVFELNDEPFTFDELFNAYDLGDSTFEP
ncbi:MAG: hypothetical protein IH931_01885, partial [candidate division Zixibacteria bacterium]|nr:hypothetical protein [candidate division Zixibacteria bacterium]